MEDARKDTERMLQNSAEQKDAWEQIPDQEKYAKRDSCVSADICGRWRPGRNLDGQIQKVGAEFYRCGISCRIL